MNIEWPPEGASPVPYNATLVGPATLRPIFDQTAEKVQEAASDLSSESDAADLFASAVSALRDDVHLALYARLAPLTGRLIATEFDSSSRGRRGLGRLSPMPPRLDARFRRRVADPDVQKALGPKIEAILASGFCAALVAYQAIEGGPPTIRDPSLGQTWDLWVPAMYQGLRGVQMLGNLTEDARDAFTREARSRRLRGPVALRKKLSLDLIARFYASAGAALYEVSTNLADDRVRD